MHDIRTPSINRRCSRPPLIFPCRPSSSVGKSSVALQRNRCTCAAADPIAWLRSLPKIARVIAAIAPFVCQIAASTAFESKARAQSATRAESIDRFAKFIEKRPIASPSRRAGSAP
jgi:hypothetical protein